MISFISDSTCDKIIKSKLLKVLNDMRLKNFKSLNLACLAFLLSGCEFSRKLDNASLKPIRYVVSDAETDYSLPTDNRELEIFEDPHTKLMGYKNKKGSIAINAQFTKAFPFSKFGVADVLTRSQEWYKIDTSGHILYKSYFFDNASDYYCSNLTRFVDKGKIGFADRSGKITIPASFDFAMPFSFSEPITVVCSGCHEEVCKTDNPQHCFVPGEMVGGKWGAIDINGNVVVPLEFDRHDFSDDNKNGETLTFFKDELSYKVYLVDGKYKLIP